MKALNCIAKRYVFSVYFAACVCCVTMLCFFTVIWSDLERGYTVVDMLTTFSKTELLELGVEFSGCNVFLYSIGESLTMTVPLLAAIPGIIPFSLERRSGCIRFTLLRCGCRSYCAATLFAAMLTGGLVLLVGYGLYGAAVGVFFPSLSDHAQALDWNCLLQIIKKLLSLFCYGAGSVLLSYILATITTNYYLSVCIPFLTDYIAGPVLNWLGERYFDIFNNPLLFIRTESLQGIPYFTERGLRSLGLYLVLTGLVLWVCMILTERRSDRGV